jgi:hypothetical protein
VRPIRCQLVLPQAALLGVDFAHRGGGPRHLARQQVDVPPSRTRKFRLVESSSRLGGHHSARHVARFCGQTDSTSVQKTQRLHIEQGPHKDNCERVSSAFVARARAVTEQGG